MNPFIDLSSLAISTDELTNQQKTQAKKYTVISVWMKKKIYGKHISHLTISNSTYNIQKIFFSCLPGEMGG